MLQFIALHIPILYGVLFEGCGRSTGSVGTFLRSTSSVSLLFSHGECTVACLLRTQMPSNMWEAQCQSLPFRREFASSITFPEDPNSITRWYTYPLQVFNCSETDRLLDVRAFCVLMRPFSDAIRKIKTRGHTRHMGWVIIVFLASIDIPLTTLSPRKWNRRSLTRALDSADFVDTTTI